LDDAVRAAAGVAVAGLILALVFLPGRTRAVETAESPLASTDPVNGS
jgi:hypothetical protein